MNLSTKHDRRNQHGDRVEVTGDITLNLDYWDCECERDYIHPLTQTVCSACGFSQEDGPSSHENEVQAQVYAKRRLDSDA